MSLFVDRQIKLVAQIAGRCCLVDCQLLVGRYSDEGITIYDSDLRLVLWNDHYSAMGITPDDHLYRGASLTDAYLSMAKKGIFGKGDPEKLANLRIEALKNGPLIATEKLNATTNRLIRINRFRLKNGGICATFRDVTDERETERQLRQSAKHDALGRLTGGVAHDLNNVLAIIVGSLELAQDDPSTSADQIELALEATERGVNLIRSLLAFSRQQPLNASITSVAKPLSEIRHLLVPIISDLVMLEISAPTDLWKTEIDVSQFETTLINLVINAKDAMTQGGTIHITASNTTITESVGENIGITPGNYVCVSVRDRGTGMSADTLEKAVDPFFTTKSPDKGTGLGLSMAHGFARQSKGYLRISSDENIGTLVKLYLPESVADTTPLADTVNSAEEVKQPLRFEGLSVLVVDDDPILCSSIKKTVSSLGCTVTSAQSGIEALNQVNWAEIDLLVTDIVMPGMHGNVLAERALKINSDLRVLYITGYAEESIFPSVKSKANSAAKAFPPSRIIPSHGSSVVSKASACEYFLSSP